ncbi:cryptochrome/photolyase family protein [Aquidulcibacter sp.]|uniref:cryptochrome/photolyase family protein n=1 Tax=Aquidulcibacter sp. TaxID=2052990 RepID=UPI0025B928E9|nr:cryptochrome/photolyase family protein [Aquidulcibacter sp.]MCA3696388.1 cryptochrome/photolyase family protein [Aquidulcibacter sp.]
MKTLRFILGDQLSPKIAAMSGADPTSDVILMVEVQAEAVSVRHHKKKIAFILASMRAFADSLRGQGFTVDYVKMDDPANSGSFKGELDRAIARHKPDALVMTRASEWRVLEMQRLWTERLDLPVSLLADHRFLCDEPQFRAWAAGRKSFVMEHFYREMRRSTGLLMEGDQPVGGRWNFDHDNRKPAKPDLFMLPPRKFLPTPRVQDVIDLVSTRFADHFGDLEDFWFATDAAGAELARDHFLANHLPRFGETQDAMLEGQAFLNHAVLSLYLNVGLLEPLDLCRRAELEWQAGRAPLAAVEGFIRQIIGWREYVRGIYWLHAPDYTGFNHLEAKRPLPALYWTGETKMACMRAAISQTKREAYAHHIQRLMVTGNFALLAGLDPHDVHEWYLSVYADAFEWVEVPNTIGMALYADGGIMASKPYAASGAYINKMSDYCGRCAYDPAVKSGPQACPFNPLYWDFIGRHEDKLGGNPRMGPVYATWRKMGQARREEIKADSRRIMEALDNGRL